MGVWDCVVEGESTFVQNLRVDQPVVVNGVVVAQKMTKIKLLCEACLSLSHRLKRNEIMLGRVGLGGEVMRELVGIN